MAQVDLGGILLVTMKNPYHPNPKNPDTVVCSCAICRKPITQRDFNANDVADKHVFTPGGALKYIALAHTPCAKHAGRPNHWQWD